MKIEANRNSLILLFMVLSFQIFSQSKFDINPHIRDSNYIKLTKEQSKDFEFVFSCEKKDTLYTDKINIDSITFIFRNTKTNKVLNVISFYENAGGTAETENFIQSQANYNESVPSDIKWLLKKRTRKFYINNIRFKYLNNYCELYNTLEKRVKSSVPLPPVPISNGTDEEKNASTQRYKFEDYVYFYNQLCKNCNIDTTLIRRSKSICDYDIVTYKRLKCGLYLNSKGNLVYNNYKNLKKSGLSYSGKLYIDSLYDTTEVNSSDKHKMKKNSLKQVIDTNSFKFIDTYFSNDKNHTYFLNESLFWVILGVDRVSFSIFKSTKYSKDKNNIYYEHLPIENIKKTDNFQVYKISDKNFYGFDGKYFYKEGKLIDMKSTIVKEIKEKTRKIKPQIIMEI